MIKQESSDEHKVIKRLSPCQSVKTIGHHKSPAGTQKLQFEKLIFVNVLADFFCLAVAHYLVPVSARELRTISCIFQD